MRILCLTSNPNQHHVKQLLTKTSKTCQTSVQCPQLSNGNSSYSFNIIDNKKEERDNTIKVSISFLLLTLSLQ